MGFALGTTGEDNAPKFCGNCGAPSSMAPSALAADVILSAGSCNPDSCCSAAKSCHACWAAHASLSSS
eukprot:11220367-Lingulodinium_polyedra.AAC.1